MPLYPTIPYVCEYCGTTFLVTVGAANVGHVRFCSPVCRARGIHPPLAVRFWAKVNKTDTCWLWTGSVGSDGYGKISIQKVHHRAPRIAWQLTNGPIPDGMYICHNCPGGDNPLCVNPAHLFLGSPSDNMMDKVIKGRQPHGEDFSHAVLREDEVRAIRTAYATGNISQARLARVYGVSHHAVSSIVLRKSWRHIE